MDDAATIVMLPGGAGDIGIAADGALRHGNNFVVRTRGLWNQRGYAVLIPDTIDRQNLRGLRSSAAYGEVVAAMTILQRAGADKVGFVTQPPEKKRGR